MTIQGYDGKERFAGCESLGNATPFVEHMLEIIEHIHIFEQFERSDVVALARHMSCYRAIAGNEIIHEGEPGEFMLLLLEGTIEIIKTGSVGVPQRIGIVHPGETLGEMSLVDGEPRFASCVSVDQTLFAVLDRDGLNQILRNESHLGIKILMELLKLLNQRLRDTGKRLVAALDQTKAA